MELAIDDHAFVNEIFSYVSFHLYRLPLPEN